MGKPYERDLSVRSWTELMYELLALHATVLRPGAFAVVNIGDVLTWPDPKPRAATGREASPPPTSPPHARRTPAPRTASSPACSAAASRPSSAAKRARCAAPAGERRAACCAPPRSWSAPPRPRVSTSTTTTPGARRRPGRTTPGTKAPTAPVDEWEHLLFFRKPGPFVHDRSRIDHHKWAEWASRGIWRIPSVGRNDDNAPRFPAELAARIVRMLTDSGRLVLDPFVGTATATAIAHLLERRWIGIDNNADIAAAALDHTLIQRPAGGASAADAGAAGTPVH